MRAGITGGLWRQTPPAIFPPILGLFGLGLAWRNAHAAFGAPVALSALILGAVSLLFVFAVIAYLAKFLRKPSALPQDLRILPGRLGLPAASGSAMLMAAALLPYSTCLARWTLLAGIGAHTVIAFVVALVLSPAPLEQRRMTPVWHLIFVGYILAPLAAIPLGARLATELTLVLTVPMALTIWAGSLYLARKHPVPPPLRPLLTIHLMPLCLFGIVAFELGFKGIPVFLSLLSVLLAAAMLGRIRYLTAAGFSPMWGAFTFPMAAFANLMLLAAPYGSVFRLLAGLSLAAATVAIPVIAFRVLKLWAAGRLGPMTNAARI